jgi:putative endopeptidase
MSLDRNNLDESADPSADFYQYANGGWLKNNPLPDEFSRYGTFDALTEENNERVRSLIEDISVSDHILEDSGQKAGNFYKTGMETKKIEKEGISPLGKYFDEIESISDRESLKSLLLKWQTDNIQLLFSFYGMPDKKNSEMVIASISQGGLGLTDVDYYKASDQHSVNIRSEYLKHIKKILILSGNLPDASTTQAKKILAFETRLAFASMTRLERRDPFKVYNMMNLEEISSLCPEFNWYEFLSKLDLLRIKEMNVSQPFFFKEISEIIADTEIETWKIWIRWSLINNYSELLSSKFVDAGFAFYGAFLSGKKKQQPRWKKVLAASNHALGEAIGKLFVEKYFPPRSKARMQALVENLKFALAERIKQLDWMTQATKLEALEKLNAINVKIGYPDKWRDYNDLKIGNTSYFDNVINGSYFNFRYFINKIGFPVDKNEWGMTPQTVNAYYNPSRNEIVFPAAILQPPFFYPEADDAVNYGAIGMVIGHELTHGFDDQGRNYDKNGNLCNWWTNEDTERFSERTQVIIDQYNQITIMNNLKADGKLTLGENIADLGGLTIAYTALLMAWKINPAKKEFDVFTPEQRFFLSYAHVWANNINEEEMRRRTKEDVHSLGHIRVNGPLRNMQPFFDAFQIKEADPMYMPIEKRAAIW